MTIMQKYIFFTNYPGDANIISPFLPLGMIIYVDRDRLTEGVAQARLASGRSHQLHKFSVEDAMVYAAFNLTFVGDGYGSCFF